MKTKVLEIRDDGTCIPALAIQMDAANPIEDRFLWRCGYPRDGSHVVLCRLDFSSSQNGVSDPYDWPENPRTMRAAHLYVLEHWDELRDGSVVDARIQLGTRDTPVEPEIWTAQKAAAHEI